MSYGVTALVEQRFKLSVLRFCRYQAISRSNADVPLARPSLIEYYVLYSNIYVASSHTIVFEFDIFKVAGTHPMDQGVKV